MVIIIIYTKYFPKDDSQNLCIYYVYICPLCNIYIYIYITVIYNGNQTMCI